MGVVCGKVDGDIRTGGRENRLNVAALAEARFDALRTSLSVLTYSITGLPCRVSGSDLPFP